MNFVEKCIQNGGRLYQLSFPSLMQDNNYTNPSIYSLKNEILINYRHMNKSQHILAWEKYNNLLFDEEYHIHPDIESKVFSFNSIGKYDENMNLIEKIEVNTNKFDTYNPLSTYIGLEDASLIRWDNKFYLCGVRKDVDIIGKGRMELSEIKFIKNEIIEISRHRIDPPEYYTSYCEKNWMPILDMPYHFIRWINPTEILYYDIHTNKSKVILSKEYKKIEEKKFHGGSQVISHDKGYICLCHETYYKLNGKSFPNGLYKHRFIAWDKDWNIVKTSPQFTFLGNEIEFCIGMSEYNDNYLITFGVNECFSFLLKISKNYIDKFLIDI